MTALRLRLLLWPLSVETLRAVQERVQGKALAGDRAMGLALPAVTRLAAEAARACGPVAAAPMFVSCRTASRRDARHRPSPPPGRPARAGAEGFGDAREGTSCRA